MTNPGFVWEEDRVPAVWADCNRCELAAQRRRVIWGEGNPKAPLMIILDNPGARENRQGSPFICGTRETLKAAILESGLKIDQIYLTYLLKCRPIRKYNHELARAACFAFLEEQINALRPLLIVCMGNVALGKLFNPESEVKAIRGKMLEFKGIPVLATYHPLAARRRPNLFKFLAADLSAAAGYLNRLNPA
ncbi:MAG: uracil-DNA glycosylase [Bacillota bacterium]